MRHYLIILSYSKEEIGCCDEHLMRDIVRKYPSATFQEVSECPFCGRSGGGELIHSTKTNEQL